MSHNSRAVNRRDRSAATNRWREPKLSHFWSSNRRVAMSADPCATAAGRTEAGTRHPSLSGRKRHLTRRGPGVGQMIDRMVTDRLGARQECLSHCGEHSPPPATAPLFPRAASGDRGTQSRWPGSSHVQAQRTGRQLDPSSCTATGCQPKRPRALTFSKKQRLPRPDAWPVVQHCRGGHRLPPGIFPKILISRPHNDLRRRCSLRRRRQ